MLHYRLGKLAEPGFPRREGTRGTYRYAVTPAGEAYLNEEYAEARAP